jgi:hypothetical protein
MTLGIPFHRLAATLAVAVAVLALFAVDSRAGASPDGPQDPGPTPPVLDEPEPAPEHVDPELPVESEESGPDEDVDVPVAAREASAPSAGAGPVREGARTDARTGTEATSIDDVALARTGFPILALVSIGGLTILGGLGLMLVRRD